MGHSLQGSFISLACILVISCILLYKTVGRLSVLDHIQTQESMQYKMFSSANLVPKHDGSLVLVIETLSIDNELNSFVNTAQSIRNNTVIYILSKDHTFTDYSNLWESTHNSTARIVHCDPSLCDSLVYTFLEYEVQDFVGILRWDLIISVEQSKRDIFMSQLLSDISLPLGPLDTITITRTIQDHPYFALFTANHFRNVCSHPCFSTEYVEFNAITKLVQFASQMNSMNCTVRGPNEANSKSAVILTLFKRNYLRQILPLICSQTVPPSLLLFVQNDAFQNIDASRFPQECQTIQVEVHHIWLSNWNSFSYMRHFVPVPSKIHTTILVDDDMFLNPSAFEKGMEVMRTHHCIATERGKRIDSNPEGHANWPLWIGKELTKVTFVDYGFIPLFMDTEWRKSVYKVTPFSRVYGDILFVSLAIYQDRQIAPCVVPAFDFFLRNEDGDVHSTSKRNRNLYNMHYNQIASKWLERGYVPIAKRSGSLFVVFCTFLDLILLVYISTSYCPNMFP